MPVNASLVCSVRRWSQGLLFHQAMVDCCRAGILIPLGLSILRCEPVKKCSLVETAFLLLVTVSTVNMLTTVLNDSPVFPEDDEQDKDLMAPLLMDSPQCVLFGTFMIWFASITINLGPTFLSGALAANSDGIHNAPSCPLVHGPFRHYVLNVLWIIINVICVLLTLFHLHKLHRDLTKANVEAVRVAGLVTTLVSVTGGGGLAHPADSTNQNRVGGASGGGGSGALEEHRRMRNYLLRVEREGVQRVKMFLVITAAYVIFWGPLFFVTLVHHPVIGNPLGYEVNNKEFSIHNICTR
uniref:G-protein coupled receptors family 1 profile domain-containing protein n=1 Tax=Rhodnius prolixus TaxID=13249 RepID=T1HBM0_RHOPR